MILILIINWKHMTFDYMGLLSGYSGRIIVKRFERRV